MKEEKKKRGRPKKSEEEKKSSVTFMLQKRIIKAIGGMDKVRQEAVNHFSKL